MNHRGWHALPDRWEHLGYDDFLDTRRRLMGSVVRDAFAQLDDRAYRPSYPAPQSVGNPATAAREITLADLVDADLLPPGTTLLAVRDTDITATVLADGRICFRDQVYDSPSAAAVNASGGARNGWTYWIADLDDGRFSLSSLRESRLNRRSADA